MSSQDESAPDVVGAFLEVHTDWYTSRHILLPAGIIGRVTRQFEAFNTQVCEVVFKDGTGKRFTEMINEHQFVDHLTWLSADEVDKLVTFVPIAAPKALPSHDLFARAAS